MDQLSKAIEYLNTRSIETKKGNGAFIRQMGKVIPSSDVNAVLSMIQEGTFEKYLTHLKGILPEKDIAAFSPDFWLRNKRTIPPVPPADREYYISKSQSLLRLFIIIFLSIAGIMLIGVLIFKIINCQ